VPAESAYAHADAVIRRCSDNSVFGSLERVELVQDDLVGLNGSVPVAVRPPVAAATATATTNSTWKGLLPGRLDALDSATEAAAAARTAIDSAGTIRLCSPPALASSFETPTKISTEVAAREAKKSFPSSSFSELEDYIICKAYTYA
jgi:hypothetical protein